MRKTKNQCNAGRLLRKLRERRGISQQQLSRILKLNTAQSISNIERGLTPLPPKHINKVAKVFAVSQRKIIKALLADEYRRLVSCARTRV